MQIFQTKKDLRDFLKSQGTHKSLGFVPTMGALHEGHIALVRQALKENDLVVCSIFVNPIQFNNANDFANYPKTFHEDCEKLKKVGCNVVFVPDAAEMYPVMPALSLSFGEIEDVMEGAKRPGHFRGVGIVVSKLFHMVMPDRAYFGQKDLQQCLVIETLVRDLSFPTEIKRMPTVREKDGLAMSSRNMRLTEKERAIAPKIHQALLFAEKMLQMRTELPVIIQKTEEFIASEEKFTLEYFEITRADNLQPLRTYEETNEVALCIALFLGNVRLIDNIIVSL